MHLPWHLIFEVPRMKQLVDVILMVFDAALLYYHLVCLLCGPALLAFLQLLLYPDGYLAWQLGRPAASGPGTEAINTFITIPCEPVRGPRPAPAQLLCHSGGNHTITFYLEYQKQPFFYIRVGLC